MNFNFAPTHDRTGTAVYRLHLRTSEGFEASQDYTITVMDRPDDLPTDIDVGETEYHLNIGDTFTFTDEMVSFIGGNVPEDAWTNVNFGYLEWGIDSIESFHWLDDVNGFEVTFDQNGRYMFSAMAWINNYLVTKHIYIDVGTGVPDGVNVEYWGTERTIYSNSHEQAWGFYAELKGYSLLPEERLEWTLEQVSEGEAVAFVERNFDAGHRELGCRYDVLPTGEATGTVVYRLTLTTDSGFTSSKDMGKTWTEPVMLEKSINCRPRMLHYNGGILMAYNYLYTEAPPSKILNNNRTAIKLCMVNPENPNESEVLAELYNRREIVNISVAEIFGDVYLAYSTSEAPLEYINYFGPNIPVIHGKDAIRYVKLGNFMED